MRCSDLAQLERSGPMWSGVFVCLFFYTCFLTRNNCPDSKVVDTVPHEAI